MNAFIVRLASVSLNQTGHTCEGAFRLVAYIIHLTMLQYSSLQQCSMLHCWPSLEAEVHVHVQQRNKVYLLLE